MWHPAVCAERCMCLSDVAGQQRPAVALTRSNLAGCGGRKDRQQTDTGGSSQ